MSILVTEDNKTNQVLIKAFLEKLNHHVTLADNGQQAIDKVQQQNFDLVLMDMMMPVMDGITATKYMREELKMTLPIYYCSIVILTFRKMQLKSTGSL